VLVVLRVVGIFNVAIWLGASFFFTFGIAPATFSPEMKSIFGNSPYRDYYVGIIAQNLIGSYFALNLICGLIALGHFFAEMIYAGKSFHRFTFGLLVGMLGLGLLGSQVFGPKIKALHQLKYRGTVAEQPVAKKQLARVHAVSMIGNLLGLVALVIYTWRVTNPPDPTRFVSAQKFRG